MCTSIQNFKTIALKMSELWLVENVDCTYVHSLHFVRHVTTESSSKSKSILPKIKTVLVIRENIF